MENFSEPTREDFVTGAERYMRQGFAKGREQGIAQGIAQGREQGKELGVQSRNKEFVNQMSRLGYQPSEIARVTNLSLEAITRLLIE